MQRVYVLEQTFENEGHSPRGGTVSDVSAWLDELDGVRCQAAGDVLLLLGISETVLAAARAVLRARWGARLRLGPLRVRYAGFPLREPVMDLFVVVAAALGESVRRELRGRHARILFTTVNETSWLVRAQAPMADLLGFPAALRALAGERADHWMTFNRWWPLSPEAATRDHGAISARSEDGSTQA